MFGISLQKLLVLIGVLAAVWGFFAWASKQKKLRERRERDAAQLRARRPAQKEAAPRAASPEAKVEEMTTCRVCKAYVAAGAKGCGKPACPYL